MLEITTPPIQKDLETLLEETDYQNAEPFAHCSIDDLISDELLEHVLDEFPDVKDESWLRRTRKNASVKKQISGSATNLGPYTSYLVGVLTSANFVRFLESLTGIDALVPDPHLTHGGLHQYPRGGSLELHADYSFLSELKMYRRVNLLLYLNPGWQEEYNGHLELWDADFKEHVEYLPTMNRTVIATIMPRGYHGLPAAIACPESETRKSLAIWYYTSTLPRDLQVEYAAFEPAFIKRANNMTLLDKLVPPILVEIWKQPRAFLIKLLPPGIVKYIRDRRS